MGTSGIPLDDWLAQGRVFSYRGHQIRWWEAGAGEPLLLIHGFPSGSWDWHYLWEALAGRYRVIALDMIGFAFSDKPRQYPYDLLDQADLQQALMTHLQVAEYHVLAHDYGDSVAQELLARHQQGKAFLRSMCFLNGGLFPETHHPVLLQKLLMSPIGSLIGRRYSRERMARTFGNIFGPQTQPDERELDAFWRMIEFNQGQRIMHLLIRYMADRRVHRDRWVAAMQQTRLPMRVIDGAVDPVSGAHMVERYRQLIPNPDTVLLPHIGHYPQVEAPDQVLEHYLAFRQRLVEQAAEAAPA
ncbi:alpha/beta fold hydrolase [Halopseudomonas maritima]|uniref:alpha/beta fold hydrolase n=1 Tax=Halopseudomonas maritima TaxID=2918528 RepID=UPI001EEAB933|nr:alpha/beta hydrolase [Halopseudomonas maritima]UJJ30610.1 alpha/beta hydrolase [Halopseudomonas maritima]